VRARLALRGQHRRHGHGGGRRRRLDLLRAHETARLAARSSASSQRPIGVVLTRPIIAPSRSTAQRVDRGGGDVAEPDGGQAQHDRHPDIGPARSQSPSCARARVCRLNAENVV